MNQKMVLFHGDVVLIQADKLPSGLKKAKTNILKHGEMTGHAHTLPTSKDGWELFTDDKGKLFIKNENPIPINHQGHNSEFTNIDTGIKEELPAGIWEVSDALEYDHFTEEARKVRD